MSINILNLLDLVLEVPQGTDRLRELILGLAFEGQLSDDPTKPDWDMDRNLKDLGKMIRGITYAKSDSRKDQDDNLTPLLGAANIQQEINYSNLTYVPSKLIKSEQLLLNGDILICMSSGSKHLVGKAAPVQDPIRASFGAFCAVYRSTSLVDSNYLALFFQSPKYRREISSSSRGIGINNLRIGDIESISIPLPPLKEQANIVDRVTELLNLCNELHKSRNLQLALATSVRKSAVNAISAAQTREELQIAWDRIEDNWEVIAGNPESILSLRQLLIDLAIQGQLFGKQNIGSHGYPVDWDVRDFKSICDIEGGNQPPKSVFISEPKENYIQLFQIRDLGSKPVPVYIPSALARSTSVDGEILIGRYGASVGKIFRAKTGAYNVALVKFIFPKERLDSEFVYWFLKSSRSQALFTGMSRSAQAGFNKGDLAPLLIPIPSTSEQQKIIERLNSLMNICDQLERSFIDTSNLADKFARSVVSASA